MLRYIDRKSEDLDLIRRMSKDDKNAFDGIYNSYWEQLLKYSFKLTRCLETSQEIVQDLFVDLWVQRKRIEIKTSLKSYLFNALRYKIIDHIKRSKKREDYIHEMLVSYMSISNDTENQLYYSNLHDSYEAALQTLPPKCREVFQMSRNDHKSIDEISKELNLSSQTVKNQISRALKILRTNLKDFVALLLFAITMH
ncbi:MAG: RNA polymerase sigma-70 factor [Cyclobacteriaceae bacterium]|nr:RNA polymerase sigma-70 factor [Cyclobacteriaceae bacterium]